MIRSNLNGLLLGLFLVTGCNGGAEDVLGQTARVDRDDVLDAQRGARACRSGDSCVLAGRSGCTCPAPVNTSKAKEVDDLAANVVCEALLIDCVGTPRSNPRCVDGRCVAD